MQQRIDVERGDVRIGLEIVLGIEHSRLGEQIIVSENDFHSASYLEFKVDFAILGQ
jgi:hypothetical protein